MPSKNAAEESSATRVLKRVVTSRAKALRKEGVGYLRSLSIVTDECYDAENGKENEISTIGVVNGVSPAAVLEALQAIAKLATKVVDWVRSNTDAKKQRKTEIRKLVEPWVASAFED